MVSINQMSSSEFESESESELSSKESNTENARIESVDSNSYEDIRDIIYRKGINGNIKVYAPDDEPNDNLYDKLENGFLTGAIESVLYASRCNFRGDDRYTSSKTHNMKSSTIMYYFRNLNLIADHYCTKCTSFETDKEVEKTFWLDRLTGKVCYAETLQKDFRHDSEELYFKFVYGCFNGPDKIKDGKKYLERHPTFIVVGDDLLQFDSEKILSYISTANKPKMHPELSCLLSESKYGEKVVIYDVPPPHMQVTLYDRVGIKFFVEQEFIEDDIGPYESGDKEYEKKGTKVYHKDYKKIMNHTKNLVRIGYYIEDVYYDHDMDITAGSRDPYDLKEYNEIWYDKITGCVCESKVSEPELCIEFATFDDINSAVDSYRNKLEGDEEKGQKRKYEQCRFCYNEGCWLNFDFHEMLKYVKESSKEISDVPPTIYERSNNNTKVILYDVFPYSDKKNVRMYDRFGMKKFLKSRERDNILVQLNLLDKHNKRRYKDVINHTKNLVRIGFEVDGYTTDDTDVFRTDYSDLKDTVKYKEFWYDTYSHKICRSDWTFCKEEDCDDEDDTVIGLKLFFGTYDGYHNFIKKQESYFDNNVNSVISLMDSYKMKFIVTSDKDDPVYFELKGIYEYVKNANKLHETLMICEDRPKKLGVRIYKIPKINYVTCYQVVFNGRLSVDLVADNMLGYPYDEKLTKKRKKKVKNLIKLFQHFKNLTRIGYVIHDDRYTHEADIMIPSCNEDPDIEYHEIWYDTTNGKIHMSQRRDDFFSIGWNAFDSHHEVCDYHDPNKPLLDRKFFKLLEVSWSEAVFDLKDMKKILKTIKN